MPIYSYNSLHDTKINYTKSYNRLHDYKNIYIPLYNRLYFINYKPIETNNRLYISEIMKEIYTTGCTEIGIKYFLTYINMKSIEDYGRLRNGLRIDEHDELNRMLNKVFAEKLPAIGDPTLNVLYGPFRANYLLEEKIMLPILASPLTPVMVHANRERKLEMSAICNIIEKSVGNEFEPDRKAAGVRLSPIVHAYRGQPKGTLTGETSNIRNFIDDIEDSRNVAAAATLGLAPHLTRLRSLNSQLEAFLVEREKKWSSVHQGPLQPVRRSIDKNFRDLAEFTNILYKASLIASTPRSDLENLIDEINETLHPFRHIIARRRGARKNVVGE